MKKETLNTIIAGGVILAVAGIAILIFRKPKNTTSPNPFDPTGGGGNSGGGGGAIPPTSLNYSEIADNLFNIFDGYGTVGTGANAVVEELNKLRTRQDWEKLVQAYGTRTVSSGWGNIFQSNFTGTLPECLRDELDSSELADVNQELSRIGVSI